MTYKFLNRIGLVLGAAVALPLMAAEPTSYYFNAAVIDSQGDLRKLTQNPFGFGAELGVKMTPADFGLDLVGHVGYLGVTQYQNNASDNYTAKAGHFGVGLSYPMGKLPGSIEIGLVMHSWDISNLYTATGGKGENGWKLGGRIVATFNLDKTWGVNLAYTASEWRRGVNPSYVTTGVVYRF